VFGELDFDQFSHLRKQFFSPGQPIDSPQHLIGRDKQLAQIRRTLDSPGRHIFIFGERGVGKTSLARTAAFQAPGFKFDPVYVGCDRLGTFFDLASAIIDELSGRVDQSIETKSVSGLKIGGLLSGEKSSEVTKIYPNISSLTQFVQALKAVTSKWERPPIIIIDELERFDGKADKPLIADMIKRISDDGINAKFVLCGIANSLSELIGEHPSAERVFSPIELRPLHHDKLWEIIDAAAEAFSVEVPRGIKQRIGVISDGFPYYTQLIGEQMFWVMYEDDAAVSKCSKEHFQSAVDRAVDEALFTLREKYDKAVLKYRNTVDFKHTLWAWVAHPTLSRQVSDVYNRSYLPMARELKIEKLLSSAEFNSRTWHLTQESHSSVLLSKGNGWYEFSEKMMRGYVRLKARAEGVDIDEDIHPADVK
jgi:uncharacterized protein